ncbi:MAG: phosphoribosyl-AMP cyclohydrolase [Candidatus Hermodarchaeota archaeon]
MRKFSKKEIKDIIEQLDFSKIPGNLIPVVVQDHVTNEVLMLAYANKEAIERSLESGLMHYYSRSRQEMWKKGETSGHFQEIEEVFTDCDNDTVLMFVKQIGGACHEGYYSCFYKRFRNGKLNKIKPRIFDPNEIYGT